MDCNSIIRGFKSHSAVHIKIQGTLCLFSRRLTFLLICDILLVERISKVMVMNNKTYDILKWVALVGLYALATLINGLGEIWSIPYAIEIVKTINLLGTVLGIVLGISNINYKKKVSE